MAKDLNQCNFTGRVGNDIDLKYMPSGDAACSISLAVSDSYKDKNGDKRENTTWVRCALFGKLAEIASQYVSKGDKLLMTGSLRERKYTKQDGTEASITELRVSEMIMLGSKQGGDQAQGQSQQRQQSQTQQQRAQQPQRTQAPQQAASHYEDDIPF